MLAQKRRARQTVVPRARRRKQHGLLRALLCNGMVCILVFAAAACVVLTVYVSAYAKVAEEGYRRSDMVARLAALKIENQELKVQLDILRRPDRITDIAIENGMLPGTEMAFLRCPKQDFWVAENTTTQD